MCIVKKDLITSNWSIDSTIATPFLRTVMSRNEFENIFACKNIAIDEGTVPFKGRIHFKCYNANKPHIYGIKTFKVCDSSNAYCRVLDIYGTETDDGTKASKFGKTRPNYETSVLISE